MIATILKSSSTFSAVRYNERKVEHGVAELVTIRNFGYLQEAPEMRGSPRFGTILWTTLPEMTAPG